MTTKKHEGLKAELWPVENIIPYELNAKNHDPEQVHKIAKSISKFGWDVPIVVDRHGVIIKGHGRRLAAIYLAELGDERFKRVPVIIRDDLTPEEVRAARLADNRVAISDVDPTKLQAELSALDYDMSGIFEEKELDFLDADLGHMNTGVFVSDMNQTVADQKNDLDGRIDNAAKAPVPIHKAFGFKNVPGGGQLPITQFMAICEAKTGKQGGDALVEFVRERLGAFEEML